MSRGELFQYSHRDPSETGEPKDHHYMTDIHPWDHTERDRLDREVEEYLRGLGQWHDITSPSLVNFSASNGTIDIARYSRIGDTVFVRFKYTFGTTYGFTGNPGFLLPFPAKDDGFYTGWAKFNEAGTGNWISPVGISSSNCVWYAAQTSGGDLIQATFTNTNPGTPASGDTVHVQAWYEADPLT